jgi:hypothetical protein
MGLKRAGERIGDHRWGMGSATFPQENGSSAMGPGREHAEYSLDKSNCVKASTSVVLRGDKARDCHTYCIRSVHNVTLTVLIFQDLRDLREKFHERALWGRTGRLKCSSTRLSCGGPRFNEDLLASTAGQRLVRQFRKVERR